MVYFVLRYFRCTNTRQICNGPCIRWFQRVNAVKALTGEKMVTKELGQVHRRPSPRLKKPSTAGELVLLGFHYLFAGGLSHRRRDAGGISTEARCPYRV